MTEPFYIQQGTVDDDNRQEWISRVAEAARESGAKWMRCSLHDDYPDLILLEAWRKQPSDQGKQRWVIDVPTAT